MIERYTREEMGRLWSRQAQFDSWLEVELAVCRAMETVGDVPVGTAERIEGDGGVKIDADRILESLMDLKEDGSFRLNMDYFTFASGLTMTGRRFAKLFGGRRREPGRVYHRGIRCVKP